ncbi:hypothetical protein XENTR_v10013102 [Xenopus tropicalis]|uniref:Uncharacterized protein n=1 Tax=Xenopus tropicalis TaxID=8364 RepID=A0A6I8RVF5_XENTR|nr:hypothetical protein XENTR_v10013102 [Xenopus tropicalis]
MPVPFLLLRTLLVRAAGSRLAVSGARQLTKGARWARSHLLVLLQRLWARITSEETRQALLGCVLCLLNLQHKSNTDTGAH